MSIEGDTPVSENQYAKALEERGIDTVFKNPEEVPFCGRTLFFNLPSGHEMILYSEKDFVGKDVGTTNPEPWPDGLTGVGAHWLDHALLMCELNPDAGVNKVAENTQLMIEVETITAKATDYSATAKADSETVFSGAGMKSKSAKISDVESLVADYASWLQRLKDDPDGGSASSTAQVSQINFKSYDTLGGTDSGLISKEGDQIYVYIDGNKYSQNYISVTASSDLDGSGGAPDDTDNKIASRIATYKALADKLSEIPGLRAYMAAEPTGTANNDVLEDEAYSLSTKTSDMVKGIIQIESLIPGKAFTITEVGEISGSNTVAGAFQTGTPAVEGTGVGALESSKEALARAITGKQQDVYTPSDLGIDGTADVIFGKMLMQDNMYQL